MDTQVLERDAFEPPVINSWRQGPSRDRGPSREQVRYATDLCRSELPYAERIATIATFAVLDSQEMSELITELAGIRSQRMARLRRTRRRMR